MSDISSIRGLTDVPEEEGQARESVPSSPYSTSSAAASTSTINGNSTAKTSKKPASIRTLGRSSNDQLNVPSGSSSSAKRVASVSSTSVHHAGGSTSGSTRSRHPQAQHQVSLPRIRPYPRLPHDKSAEIAPSTIMYWSRAPCWGTLPMRTLRAHTVNLVDTTAWIFGGAEDKESWKDIYCFDIETMQWTHPETTGELPHPMRAHSSTLWDRKLIIFGGGLGPTYYDTVYIFDTMTRKWSRPQVNLGPRPAARRAHSAVPYNGKLWIFGGGNGLTALNDLWTLDISHGFNRPMSWECVETTGKRPGPRGYHTANLVGNIMVVMGGSDSKDCFTDVWFLNLDTLVWSIVKQQQQMHKRIGHSATQVGSYIFVFAGHSVLEYSSDLLTYNLVTLQYEPRTVLGTPPSPRGNHAAILADSRLFIFGGYDGHLAYNDVHILDLAAGAYLPQVTSFIMEASQT